MIHGLHLLLYSADAAADRAFLRDVLGWPAVDAGQGWLIFGAPPAEVAVHPSDGPAPAQEHAGHALLHAVPYLMCDDVRAEVAALARKGVVCAAVGEASWGLFTAVPLPSGRALGLYQPTHPVAIDLPHR
jgi:hypothetical protein